MKKNDALEKAAPFKYRCEWGNRFNSTSSPPRKLASNSHDHPLFNQFLHGSFGFFTTTFPCFQIWKFIQLKHPLKMDCFEDRIPASMRTRDVLLKGAGMLGRFWPEKNGVISSFSRIWKLGPFSPHKKKWWANNMSPTRCFFFFWFWRTHQAQFFFLKDLVFQTS